MNQTERKYLIELMNVLGQMNHPGRDSKDVGMIMSVKDRNSLISKGWKLIEASDKLDVHLANLLK